MLYITVDGKKVTTSDAGGAFPYKQVWINTCK
jgi:hypothetical protein